MHDTAAWRFEDSVTEERRSALGSSAPFDELICMAAGEIQNICVRVAPGQDLGLTHCFQPVFAFELPSVGDLLFNGPHGYRAQYWRGPLEGLAANAKLIGQLAAKLLAAADPEANTSFAKINLRSSLRAASAKFWIQEIPSLLVSPTTDLRVEPWQSEARRGVQLARWGLSAPEVTRFDVKGALLDAWGNEVVPSRKVERHYDIHHYGFS